jgi:hypothetical protein
MRTASIIAALVALVLLVLGGVALWGADLSTSTHRFATPTHALASDNLDLDVDGLKLGTLHVSVEPRTDEPMFVGIAPTRDVSRYLRGTAHALVTDVSFDPFEADYRPQPGGRPAAPASQDFWAASAHGAGAQTLNWDVEDGDWSIVVMNDDASAAVDAGVSVRAELPWLSTLGWVLIAAGALTLLGGVTGLSRTAVLSR